MNGPSAARQLVVTGVTGGIGAGKSTAMEAFVRRGAVAFSADEAVHRLYATDEVREAVVDRWGDGMLGADGSVDRGAIAEIVFQEPEERRWLEGLLHPLVAREWLRFVHEARSSEQPPELVVAEVPLLFEAGLEARYDAVVAITAPLETRLARVGQRAGGGSRSKERAAAQLSDAEKAARADFSYENTGSLEDLERFVHGVIEALLPGDAPSGGAPAGATGPSRAPASHGSPGAAQR